MFDSIVPSVEYRGKAVGAEKVEEAGGGRGVERAEGRQWGQRR